MIRRPPTSTLFPSPPLSRPRRILHVLNRLAFGPRPGDVARVRAVGLDAWTDRQLRPETIDDSATERRSEEHTSELQSQSNLVCRLLLEKKKKAQTVPDRLYC